MNDNYNYDYYDIMSIIIINSFVPNAPFLYCLKTGAREMVHLERMD